MSATISDIAKIAGVSIATVSRVINGQGKVGAERRKHVQKIIDELGYKPNSSAKSLASQKLSNVGLVTPKISMEFFGKLAAGVEVACREKQHSLLICNSLYEEQAEANAIDDLASKGCDSIILHSDYMNNTELLKYAKKYSGLVIINRFVPEIAHRCVWFDNVGASMQLANYVVNNNHKDIAYISSIYRNRDPQDRLTGTKQAMMLKNLKINESLIVESTANIDGGKECIRKLIQVGKPFTAVIAYNDLMAVGAIHELVKNGYRVPEDVSVVGFDDSTFGRACMPELTTVKYPIGDMAKYAVELSISLANKMRVESDNKTHLFTSQIVHRDSLAANR